MRITIDTIVGMRPCYARARVEALFGGRDVVSVDEIVADDRVPQPDRLWVLLRLAPRAVWLPAIFRAAEYAIRTACGVLPPDIGEELAATAPPVVNTESADAAANAAVDAAAKAAGNAAYVAAHAAYAANAAAKATANSAANAAYAAAHAAYAANATAYATAYAAILSDVGTLVAKHCEAEQSVGIHRTAIA